MTQTTNDGLIVTDLATSENYYTGHSDVPGVDVNRRYAYNATALISLAPIPPLFGTPELANGIVGHLETLGAAMDSAQSRVLRIVAHGPAAPAAHQSGWRMLEGPIPTLDTDTYEDHVYAAIAAQRYRDSFIAVHTRLLPGSGSYPTWRCELEAWRDSTGPYVHPVIDQPRNPASGLTYFPPLQPRDLFVSDAEDPFIWSYEGPALYGPDVEVTGLRLSTATAMGDNALINQVSGTAPRQYVETQYRRSGHLGAYRHRVARNDAALEPRFVKPWATDNVEAPELWFAVPDYAASTITLYRSRWKAGQRQRINYVHISVDRADYGDREVLIDDDSFTNGQRRYPRLNPYGYAFEQNWQTPANRIATVGPFPDLLPKDADKPTPEVQFHIERDRVRAGVLHLVLSVKVPTYRPYAGKWKMWFSTSRDDGLHWSAPTGGLIANQDPG